MLKKHTKKEKINQRENKITLSEIMYSVEKISNEEYLKAIYWFIKRLGD